MPLAKRTIKAIAASLVAKLTPWAFFYLAPTGVRKFLQVSSSSGWIDIADNKGRRKIRISRNHSIYLPHLAECFDYFYGSATPIAIRSKGVVFRVVDFSTPRYQEIAGFPEFPILCPSFTEPFITTQQYLDFAQLREGDVVIDLGCYSGLTSIAFSKAVGQSGKVIALEPDPAGFGAAKTNVARHSLLNGIENVVLLNKAASSGRGVISFASDGTMGAADGSIVGSYRGESIQVESLGLQDIVESCSLKTVDLIKIDVEGSELKVLAGAEGFFRKFRPKLIVEPHMVDGVFSDAAIFSILKRFHYQCQTVTQVGLSWPLIIAIPEVVNQLPSR